MMKTEGVDIKNINTMNNIQRNFKEQFCKNLNIDSYLETAQKFLDNKPEITTESIINLKKAEASVNPDTLNTGLKTRFRELKTNTDKEIAYWMNKNIDIVPYVQNAGFSFDKINSTQRWQKYKKGGDSFLVTHHNTLKNVKTGKSSNLFELIKEQYPKAHPNISDTKHMVDTVLQNEGMRVFVKPLENLPVVEQTLIAKPVAKKFSLKDYRTEKLNVYNNCLLKRGITTDTLKSPLFDGAILQGNKATANIDRNNVIYPFKSHPALSNDQMKTLLQQYGKKIPVGGKEIDKVFAAGSGKNQSLWLSNMPEKIDRVYVFENPLDALSHYQKYRPENSLYCATGGNPAQGQQEKILMLCKEFGKQPVLCFDNDMAGCRFDTQFLASVKPEKMSIAKVGDEFYNVKLSNLTESDVKNVEMVCTARNISIIDKGSGELTAVLDCTEKACKFNDFANDCILKTDVKIEKSVMKDFNDDLVNNVSKQYGSMLNQVKFKM